jgi:TetR/AcrR family transcriptional regulator
LPKQESRETILSAARAEFAARGFAGARVDRIARASGLNKQLIYYYFGSKQALYSAATSVPPSPATLASPDPATAADRIRQVVDGLLGTFTHHPEIISLLVDRSGTPEGIQTARQWIKGAQRDAAAALSRGQGLGHFRDDLDPRATARAALVLCLGYLALAPHLEAGLDDWASEVRDILVRAAAW